MYVPGNTGGEESHILTINEMPAHSHRISNRDGGTSGWGLTMGGPPNGSVSTDPDVGGSQPHLNMPPYFSLAFIMKL